MERKIISFLLEELTRYVIRLVLRMCTVSTNLVMPYRKHLWSCTQDHHSRYIRTLRSQCYTYSQLVGSSSTTLRPYFFTVQLPTGIIRTPQHLATDVAQESVLLL